MRLEHGLYEIDDSLDRIDFQRCHGWLAESYWSPGISRELVEHGFRHSTLVAGAYRGGEQVGCLRVASDRARFAYLMDVFVAPGHRARGLGRAMVRFALEHPDLRLVRLWMLATNDAHDVYRPLGFTPIDRPERFMRLERPGPGASSAPQRAALDAAK